MKGWGEWSTRGLQRGRQAAGWSHFLTGEGEGCPFSSLGGADFDGRLSLAGLLDAQIAWIVGGPLRLKDAAADGAGRRLCVYAVADGQVQRVGDGPAVSAGPGDVLVCRGNPSAELRSSEPVRLAAAVFPERLVLGRIVRPGALRTKAANRSLSLATRLLHDLLTGLATAAGAPPRPGVTLEVLTAATVMMLDDGVAVPQDAPTQAASRLVAIHEHLRLFYPDPRLTPAKTADALQISVRYLHKLMIQSGRSFREELTRLRLEACRAVLADPFRQGETIAEIAFSAGFNDLSQFNRHFRAAFGVTPSRARNQAIGILDNASGALAVRPAKPKANGRPPETVQ
jgi:AraC-like DNA-binding protein